MRWFLLVVITQRVNGHATNEFMTQQWNKYAHLSNNAKCNFVEWKIEYATTWDTSFPSNENAIIPKWTLDYNSISKT